MLAGEDAVVWVNTDTKQLMVRTLAWGRPEEHGLRTGHWIDPIGAAYGQWQKGTSSRCS
jgi:hypothetical protein